MIIKIHQTPTAITVDRPLKVYFDDPILAGYDIDDLSPIDSSPLCPIVGDTLYVATPKNYDTIRVAHIIDARDLPSSQATQTTQQTSGIKDVVVVDGKIRVIEADGTDRELDIDVSDSITTTPDIPSITVFTNQEKKLSVLNYSPNTLYSTTSKYIDIREDGIYLRPMSTDEPLVHRELTLFATGAGRTISEPAYINVTIINLSAGTDSTKSSFITGRIFTIDNIRADDIVEYENIDIQLGD